MGEPGKNVTIEIEVPLTDEESKQMGVELANMELEAEELEDERKLNNSAANEVIKNKRSEIRRTCLVLNRGFEVESKECLIEIDVEESVRRWRDTTTGEVHKTEALEPGEEHQGEMKGW